MTTTRQTTGAGRPRDAVSPKGRRAQAFTLIELLVVITIIAALAGLLVGLSPVVATRMREGRVNGQLEDLISAIEQYKLQVGTYPPDNYNPNTGVTDSGLNTLYYELTGLFAQNNGPTPHFVTPDGSQALDPASFSTWFNRDGVVNAVAVGRRRKFVHPLSLSQHAQIFRTTSAAGYAPLEVLAVGFITDATGKRGAGFAWPTDNADIVRFGQPIPGNPGLNPWHYVSTNPTNNPGAFDLWAEVIVNGEKRIYGNWKQ